MPNEFIVDTILPKLNLSSDIISDIQTVINQGKEVTTHTNNVSVPGWSGAGYIIIDPKTGDGAYLISGGANGGFILNFIDEFLFIFAALFTDKSIFLYEKILKEQASKIIRAAIKPLILGSLFMSYTNSAYACSNISDTLIMVVIHSIMMALLLIIAGAAPPFGFMAATIVSLNVDFIVKPIIQDFVCGK